MGLIDFLFFLLLIGGAQAFVFSCNEIKDKLINKNLQEPTRFVCLVPQEGYSNFDALKNIYAQSDKVSTSFYDLLSTCVERPSNGPWRIVADLPLALDCTHELSLIFTSSSPPLIASAGIMDKPGELIIVQPQTGIVIATDPCSGSGNVTIFTGAGSGVAEYRFPMASWTCADKPNYIVSFENVITIVKDEGIDMQIFFWRHDTDTPINTSPPARLVVMASGKSDDLQVLQGSDNQVQFNTLPYTNVDGKCTGALESGSYVAVEPSEDSFIKIFYVDATSFTFNGGNNFTVEYVPNSVSANDLWNDDDNFVCDFTLSDSTPTAVAVPSTTSASSPTLDADPYCKCGLDKFGMNDNYWDPTEIWLDIAIILDTSEAMGTSQLIDAATLIDSFFGTEDEDVLTTNTNATFYTRVGLIAMSDKPEVLYNMNMTKDASVLDNVRIKDGLQQIDILAAFKAAQQMLEDGLALSPARLNTRQVIYYMTDSAPKFDPTSPNAFKNSFGIIIVNNFIDADVIERPSLKDLASPGYYSTDIQENYMDSIQLFCKANCFCRPDHDRKAYAGHNTDPAVKASGGCFHAVPTGVQYSNLKTKNCDVEGGLIASVHDADKTAFLNDLVHAAAPKSAYFWIGYTKSDAGWTWEDKSSNPYTDWDTANGEPSTNSVAKCAYVDMTSLLWGAGNCNTGFPGVCEYKPCSVGNDNC